MLNKFILVLLSTAIVTPCIAGTCDQCGKYTRNRDICGSCSSKNTSNANAQGQAMMGMGMALIGGMLQAAEKEREAEERKEAQRQAERKLAIEKANAQIMQDTIKLKLIDPSEGRHNLTIQVRPVRTAQQLKYWSGKDSEGAIQVMNLPPQFFEMPAEFNILRSSLPAMVNIAVYRNTGRNTSGQWIVKNVPLKFFFRDTQEIIIDARLDDEDELKFIIKNQENKKLFNETLAINIPFDYSHESGVDGQGLSQNSSILESVPSSKKKKRSLKW